MAQLFIGMDRRRLSKSMARMYREERQKLWSSYYKATDRTLARREEALNEFCKELMSYISFGQLNIYRPYADGVERRKNMTVVAKSIYPEIISNTYLCLDFCDNWESGKHPINELKYELEALGTALMVRTRSEDQIIAALNS